MSFGKMNTVIDIVHQKYGKDEDGFPLEKDCICKSIRAYFEPKNTTEKWRNNAVFAGNSALFRFRKPPNCNIGTDEIIICQNKRYNITSVEDVKGRGMYLEILGKAVDGYG